MSNPFSQITPEIEEFSAIFAKNNTINPELYNKYDVKRGLRDLDGKAYSQV